MLILAVLVSAFVAIFVLRKIWRIWSRGKQSENRNEEALLQQTTGGNNTNVIKNSQENEVKYKQGLTEGQRFKLAFLVGLFLTNLLRCIILVYDGLSHSVFAKSESEIRSSTVALAFMDLPTLGLMTSFSLFIYYIAQLTL